MTELEVSTRATAITNTASAESFAVKIGAASSLLIPLLFGIIAIVLAVLGAPPVAIAVVGATGPTLIGISKIVEASRRTTSDE